MFGNVQCNIVIMDTTKCDPVCMLRKFWGQNFPTVPEVKKRKDVILKSVRYEYLGNSRLGAATVRERVVSKSYREKLKQVHGTKKQFYKNSGKGLNTVGPLCPTHKSKDNIWKPIITSGELDAKIRMPPPKLPPPHFMIKNKDSISSGHLAKRSPVEMSQCHKRNRLFVPFSLPKPVICSTPPGNQNSVLGRPSKPQARIVKQNERIIAADKERRQVMTKLRPICKPGERKAVIHGNEMRKLVNSWAKNLGSFRQDERDQKRKNGIKNKNSVVSSKVVSQTIVSQTKSQVKAKHAPCVNKDRVRTNALPLINTRCHRRKFKSLKATHHTKFL